MDELFERLVLLTREAAEKAETSGLDEIDAFMQERVDLILALRRIDVQLPDNAPERQRFRKEASLLKEWDAIIVRRMEDIKAEASERLGRISDFQKQKEAYDGTDLEIEGIFLDKKW